jgi:hypothetical protein
MLLLETISVRLFEPQNSHLVLLLFNQMNQGLTQLAMPERASLLHNCSLNGDWTLQLTWPGKNLPKTKTALGRHLAESFRSIGLVHHTVWQALSATAFDIERQQAKGGEHEA